MFARSYFIQPDLPTYRDIPPTHHTTFKMSSSSQPPQSQEEDPSLQPSRIAPGYIPSDPSSSSSSSILPSSLSSAIKITKQSSERLTEGKVPCARSSLLYGAATGVIITGMGLVAGRKFGSSLNWGVGGLLGVSATSWEVCRRSRAAEQARMRTVIEQHSRKRGSNSQQSSPSSQDIKQSSPSSQDIKAASAKAKQQSSLESQSQSSPPPSRLFAREERI